LEETVQDHDNAADRQPDLYAYVPLWVIARIREVERPARAGVAVWRYAVLRSFAGRDGCCCFPPHEAIAKRAGESVRTVQRWTEQLEAWGLIERIRHERKDGKRANYEYLYPTNHRTGLRVNVSGGQRTASRSKVAPGPADSSEHKRGRSVPHQEKTSPRKKSPTLSVAEVIRAFDARVTEQEAREIISRIEEEAPRTIEHMPAYVATLAKNGSLAKFIPTEEERARSAWLRVWLDKEPGDPEERAKAGLPPLPPPPPSSSQAWW
jgi:hypothetical protein